VIWAFVLCAVFTVMFFAISTNYSDGRTAEEKMSDGLLQAIFFVLAAVSGATGVIWMIVKVAMI
jgi:hypothetical protein